MKFTKEEIARGFAWRTRNGHPMRISLPQVNDPNVWVSKDGRRQYLFEMASSHIRHCIALIEAKKLWREEYLEGLRLELYVREALPKRVEKHDQHRHRRECAGDTAVRGSRYVDQY